MHYHTALALRVAACALVLTGAGANALEADSSVTLLACSGSFADSDGGNGFVYAVSRGQAAGVCGPTPEDDAVASGGGLADIANGFAYASASADGVVGGNRATARGNFADQLYLADVPAGVDSVDVQVTLDFIADYTGSFDFSNDLIFGRVSISTVGILEIRRCTPIICPTAPIQSDSASAIYTVPRLMSSGEFPVIDVQMNTTIDVANGGGFFSGAVTVQVVDGSGAGITSQSGVFGTGTGVDLDADTVPDALDNCITFQNADQRDSNGDGFGNACDADITNDCTVNFGDVAALKAAFNPVNTPDADLDGDGFVAFGDLARLKQTFFNGPLPGPGPTALDNDCTP